ncbi:hypothetical protein [Methanogenium cariaci]|uniref:hypothetical protein n=1 Tax=Methanogenium cariaci TaxID=2197 RepID=UPI0012F68150|nr:hypothetical protein [Methanogenium cariaci]
MTGRSVHGCHAITATPSQTSSLCPPAAILPYDSGHYVFRAQEINFMNEIKKTKTGTESGTKTGIENGSPPAKKPCSHIGLKGTATEQSVAGQKKSAEPERAAGRMPTPPCPPYQSRLRPVLPPHPADDLLRNSRLCPDLPRDARLHGGPCMTADPKEIRNTLSLLFSDGGAVVELRALGDGGVHSGYFTDFDMMAERAAAINRFTDVHGVYVTLNEVNPALLSRRANRVKQRLSRSDATTADADIIRRRWLPIDFDPRPAERCLGDRRGTRRRP